MDRRPCLGVFGDAGDVVEGGNVVRGVLGAVPRGKGLSAARPGGGHEALSHHDVCTTCSSSHRSVALDEKDAFKMKYWDNRVHLVTTGGVEECALREDGPLCSQRVEIK